MMTKKGDSYFGRGTTDERPALAACMVRARGKDGGPINISFLWEFSKRVGSPNFGKLFPARRRSAYGLSGSVDTWGIKTTAANSRPRGLMGFLRTWKRDDGNIRRSWRCGTQPIGELMKLFSTFTIRLPQYEGKVFYEYHSSLKKSLTIGPTQGSP